MKFQCLKALFLLCMSSLLLVSCANINPSKVSDEDRDTTGKFDGRWKLTKRSLRSTQEVMQQRFNCNFEKATITMFVRDSVARISLGKYSGTGNVSDSGRFRVEIPTDRKFTRSDGHSDSGQLITYIYQGKLGQSKTSGLYTIGKKALNNGGCSTKLTIENRASDSMFAREGHPRTKNVVGDWSFVSKDIPEIAKPSNLSTRLTIRQVGKKYLGLLEIRMFASSSCGPMISTSKTKVSANLITEDGLIIKALENSQLNTEVCKDKPLKATEFAKNTPILLNLTGKGKKQQLTFKSNCGWSVDGRCVFERPPLTRR